MTATNTGEPDKNDVYGKIVFQRLLQDLFALFGVFAQLPFRYFPRKLFNM